MPWSKGRIAAGGGFFKSGFHASVARADSSRARATHLRIFTWLAGVLLAAVGTAAGQNDGQQPPAVTLPVPLRGMTISSHAWGGDWDSPEMAKALDELQSLGVNSFAIHPYAQVQEDGHVVYRDHTADPEYLATPLEWARERRMGVMLIPHIAYWGTKFGWRGAIDYEQPEQWDRFFEDYQTWIVAMARVAETHGVGLFCIGLEFAKAQKFEARWRQIIAAVRAVYHGKLTYGGNWDSYQEVKFYDALDYIGVLAYFPLTRTPDPSEAEIHAGWKPHCGAAELVRAVGQAVFVCGSRLQRERAGGVGPVGFPAGGSEWSGGAGALPGSGPAGGPGRAGSGGIIPVEMVPAGPLGAAGDV